MPSYQNDPVIVRTNTPSGSEGYNGGIYGESTLFNGVRGVSYAPGHGAVVGVSENHTSQAGPGVFGQSDGTGVWGTSKTWYGVYGNSESTTGGAGVMGEAVGPGVIGKSKTWYGVYGNSESTTGGAGVMGEAVGPGVIGKSKTWYGVYGNSESTTSGAGVMGEAVGPGVIGKSKTWHGVYGETPSTTGGAGVWGEHKSSGSGVVGKSATGVGVYGTSDGLEGIKGETNSTLFAAVAGIQLNPNSTGAGVYGEHKGNGPAGFFKGDVLVTGDIKLINADCAEDFDIVGLEKVEPGTVMVIDSEGALRSSNKAYDKRVAGVISGAGSYKPGLILDKQESSNNRMPIALMGKVYCKVDASYGAIEVGDLLTTSTTPGHAMKADNPLKAFGTVIGKALRPLAEGQGLIPVLVALQ
jgi:hypothetical protein